MSINHTELYKILIDLYKKNYIVIKSCNWDTINTFDVFNVEKDNAILELSKYAKETINISFKEKNLDKCYKLAFIFLTIITTTLSTCTYIKSNNNYDKSQITIISNK